MFSNAADVSRARSRERVGVGVGVGGMRGGGLRVKGENKMH